MNNTPRPGELYRHFKNKMYQIVAIATHSETKEPLVIYQALYDDFRVYARPLEMFVSEVDHVKYPEVTQKYRFEKIERVAIESEDGRIAEETIPIVVAEESDFSDASVEDEQESEEISTSDEMIPDSRLLQFLDAETMEEKYNLLVSFGNNISDKLIDDMAVVMDVVIPEGDVLERLDQLKYAIRTRQRYEYSNRLR